MSLWRHGKLMSLWRQLFKHVSMVNDAELTKWRLSARQKFRRVNDDATINKWRDELTNWNSLTVASKFGDHDPTIRQSDDPAIRRSDLDLTISIRRSDLDPMISICSRLAANLLFLLAAILVIWCRRLAKPSRLVSSRISSSAKFEKKLGTSYIFLRSARVGDFSDVAATFFKQSSSSGTQAFPA